MGECAKCGITTRILSDGDLCVNCHWKESGIPKGENHPWLGIIFAAALLLGAVLISLRFVQW